MDALGTSSGIQALLPVVQAQKGASCAIITDTGKVGGRLMGMVSSRDLDFVVDKHASLEEVMVR